MLGDLKYPQDQLVVTKGGTGGYGNIHFKSSSNRRPLEFTNGEPGEEKIVELELKTIADIGLVGFLMCLFYMYTKIIEIFYIFDRLVSQTPVSRPYFVQFQTPNQRWHLILLLHEILMLEW